MKLSLVELSPVPASGDRSLAIERSVEMAQKAEALGYSRIWVAEHHGSNSMAGRTPEVLIPLLAAKTSTIRVGSGSVLLNHYSPYKVAETFATLNDMFPGRIDMGIGRATTGPVSDIALQRNRSFRQTSDDSMEQLSELNSWMHNSFPNDHPFSQLHVANNGQVPPLWLLGSSSWSAGAAAKLGLRYAFAGFINPAQAFDITSIYRNNFRPGSFDGAASEPELILSLSVYCAPTEKEAAAMTAPIRIMMRRLSQGDISSPVPTQSEAIDMLGGVPAPEPFYDAHMPPRYIAGTPSQVAGQLEKITKLFGSSEIMVQCISVDHELRMQSHELLAKEFGIIPETRPVAVSDRH